MKWIFFSLLLVLVFLFMIYIYGLFFRPQNHSKEWFPFKPDPSLSLPPKDDFRICVFQSLMASSTVQKHNQQVCAQHHIGYVLLPKGKNELSHLYHVMASDTFPYLLYLGSHQRLDDDQHLNDRLNRLITQAGDVDLILGWESLDRLPSKEFLLFRSSGRDWCLHKLRQLYDKGVSSLLDPVYFHPDPNQFWKTRISFLKEGLPLWIGPICIYHPNSISRITRTEKDLPPKNTLYPFAPMKEHFVEISPTPLPENIITHSPRIPHVMFQSMETTLITSEMYHYSHLPLKTLNPKYRYIFVDALQGRSFLQKHFSPIVLNAYHKLLPGAYKTDLLRYCLLYIYGGIYCDSHFVPMVPFSSYITEDLDFICPTDPLNGLWQGFFGCSPRQRFLWDAIQRISRDVMDEETFPHSILALTGPQRLGECLNRFLQRSPTTSFLPGIYKKNRFVYKILCFSGSCHSRPFITDLSGHQLAMNKIIDHDDIPDRFFLLKPYPQHYSEMHNQKKIYKPVLTRPPYLKKEWVRDLRHRKVYSFSPIFNEISVLRFRMEELWDEVDKFIVVEANLTHAGHPKPMYLLESGMCEDPRYKQKLIRKELIYPPSMNAENVPTGWDREKKSKTILYDIVHEMGLDDHDLLIFSDLDEVPDPSLIHRLRGCMPTKKTIQIPSHWFNYGWNYYLGSWDQTILFTTWKCFRQMKRQDRFCDFKPSIHVPYDPEGQMGWHVSYFLPMDQILEKIKIQSTFEGSHLMKYIHQPQILREEIENGIAVNTNQKVRSRPFRGLYPKHKHLLQNTPT